MSLHLFMTWALISSFYTLFHTLAMNLVFFKLYLIILYYLTIFYFIFKKLHYVSYKCLKLNVNIVYIIEINKYRLVAFYYNK